MTHKLSCIFLWPAPLSFDWSPHLRLTCGPAGNRTTTGSLSASPYQLLHRDAYISCHLQRRVDTKLSPPVSTDLFHPNWYLSRHCFGVVCFVFCVLCGLFLFVFVFVCVVLLLVLCVSVLVI